MRRFIQNYTFSKSKPNPFQKVAESISVRDKRVTFYNLPALKDDRYESLPISIRVLLESAVRNCDEF